MVLQQVQSKLVFRVKENNMIIPKQIQIETVAGICNVKCIMCPIDQSIRKEIMSNEKFEYILKKFLPYKKFIKNVSLLGLGETFIDPNLSKKIEIAKSIDSGYPGVGVYTNGMLLTDKIAIELLNAKLDSLIVSIDGFTPETQEKIRIGSDVKLIIRNIENFINLRNSSDKFLTRIVLRFTEQNLNRNQWNDFYNFWKVKINFDKNDIILNYPIHNFGNIKRNFTPKKYCMTGVKCKEIYERIIIFSDGEIGLCCGDQFGNYMNGNIYKNDPIEIYNSGTHFHYRDKMDKGKILELELCSKCSVAYSILEKREIKK